MYKRIFLVCLLMIMSSLVWAETFQSGKDYKQLRVVQNPISDLDKSVIDRPHKVGQVTVMEFFNYGCPACFRFEPTLERWLKNKPKSVAFKRIPVVFNPSWQIYAKAYYIAEKLKVADKMNPVIFKAVQQEGLDLNDRNVMKELFVKNAGIKPQQFDNAFDFTPELFAQMNRSMALMRMYKVYQIPTVIVSNGKESYAVNPGMVEGDSAKMVQVINHLIEKSGGPKIKNRVNNLDDE